MAISGASGPEKQLLDHDANAPTVKGKNPNNDRKGSRKLKFSQPEDYFQDMTSCPPKVRTNDSVGDQCRVPGASGPEKQLRDHDAKTLIFNKGKTLIITT